MRLKYYLRGFGIGIIFATTILFIVYSFNMSDSKIKERAKELGMVAEEDTKNSEKNSESKSTTEPDSTTEPKVEPDSTTEPTSEENTTTEPESVTEPDTTTAPQSQSVTLVITSGMTSDSVARKLKELGAIDNIQEFDNYLISNNRAERIHIGSFEIPAGADYEKIAQIIAN